MRLKKQNVGFFLCYGLVSNAFWYYTTFSRTQFNASLFGSNTQVAIDDHEKFIFLFMRMPGELERIDLGIDFAGSLSA